MSKSNLEQLLEKYVKGELHGSAQDKLIHWLEVMRRNRIPGATFALPDDERLYKLLMSMRSTGEDIEAFRPYSYDPPSPFSNSWLQLGISILAITTMVVGTVLLKHELN